MKPYIEGKCKICDTLLLQSGKGAKRLFCSHYHRTLWYCYRTAQAYLRRKEILAKGAGIIDDKIVEDKC